MDEYLKFIRWDGDFALFTKASISDIIIAYSGLNIICHWFNIKEGMIILIRCPKGLLKKEVRDKP